MVRRARRYSLLLAGPPPSGKLLNPTHGEMAEWFKAHAWKACVRETYRGFESRSLRQSSLAEGELPGGSSGIRARRSSPLRGSELAGDESRAPPLTHPLGTEGGLASRSNLVRAAPGGLDRFQANAAAAIAGG